MWRRCCRGGCLRNSCKYLKRQHRRFSEDSATACSNLACSCRPATEEGASNTTVAINERVPKMNIRRGKVKRGFQPRIQGPPSNGSSQSRKHPMLPVQKGACPLSNASLQPQQKALPPASVTLNRSAPEAVPNGIDVDPIESCWTLSIIAFHTCW